MNFASLHSLRVWGLALLIGCGCALTARAGGPQISDSSDSPNWLAPLNPTQWKLPQLRWPTSDRAATARKVPEKAPEKAPGMMANMSQSLGKTWQKTKETLNPKNLMPAAGAPQPKTRKAEKESVWSGWFTAKEEPQKIETINDFLRQPSPY